MNGTLPTSMYDIDLIAFTSSTTWLYHVLTLTFEDETYSNHFKPIISPSFLYHFPLPPFFPHGFTLPGYTFASFLTSLEAIAKWSHGLEVLNTMEPRLTEWSGFLLGFPDPKKTSTNSMGF